MSQKFNHSVQQRDDVGFVKLSGVIDEDNELADLTDSISGNTVVIELGEVDRINSCGVRDWVNWLNTLEAKGADIVLAECSPAIVAQINLVNNFTGEGAVKSFYVPYFCPECDEEKVLLCEVQDMGSAPHEPPVCRCDGCDLVMDFDDMPDSYFAFLSNQAKVARPDKVQSVLDEFSKSGNDSKIRSRSSVSGSNLSGPITGVSSPQVPALQVPSLPSISNANTPSSLPSQGYVAPAPAPGGQPANHVEAENGMVVYILVAALVGAIGVLGYLLLSN